MNPSAAGKMPTIQARLLAIAMRELREKAGLEIADAARLARVDPATIYRLEEAKVIPSARTLDALLELYNADKGEQDRLRYLKNHGRETSWLQHLLPRTLPSELLDYIEIERVATSIVNFELTYIPGLLQTEAYATAVIRAANRNIDPGRIRELALARLARQEILRRANPPRLWAIMDETALRRPVGGPEVMADQLDYLAAIAQDQENRAICMQVIPEATEDHPCLTGSFSYAELSANVPLAVAYTEGHAISVYLGGNTEVKEFHTLADAVRAIARSPAESAEVILDAARRMRAVAYGRKVDDS
jgi:transcriptional regulator with XRE-family HTH domain